MHDPKKIQTNNERKSDITEESETANKSLSNKLSDKGEEAEEDSPDDYEENESNDDYGSSGEKYGWYNGFSDDAIDDAFEGDPDATWNVD